nr:MAG TPA: hypothetical protein [Caudoviricetes sp.]
MRNHGSTSEFSGGKRCPPSGVDVIPRSRRRGGVPVPR